MTGLSGVALLWAVTGLVVDQEKLLAVPLVCMSLWGLHDWGRTIAIAALVALLDACIP